MRFPDHSPVPGALVALALVIAGCAAREPLLPEETFHWVAQPIAFAPPPARWYRQGDNGGGLLGVRFILRDGGGQVMSLYAFRRLPEGLERVTSLEELVPFARMDPARRQEPERWRTGRAHDTTLAGQAAFVTEDTLIAPEQTLLYHEVFWVVDGAAFKAVYQGRSENLATFHRVVDSVRFPEPAAGGDTTTGAIAR